MKPAFFAGSVMRPDTRPETEPDWFHRGAKNEASLFCWLRNVASYEARNGAKNEANLFRWLYIVARDEARNGARLAPS